MARKTGSHSDITGPRIREAARHLFARNGFAAVSMRQIAAEVGVQAGALYLYTPDKERLLFDLLRDHMEDLLARAGALPAGGPEARLEAFVRLHLAHSLDHPEAVFLSYMELRNLGPQNFAAIEALRHRYEDLLAAILRDGQASGTFQVPEPRLASFALIAMLTGVTTWYREGGRLTRDRVAGIYLDMARGAVGLPVSRQAAPRINAPDG